MVKVADQIDDWGACAARLGAGGGHTLPEEFARASDTA